MAARLPPALAERCRAITTDFAALRIAAETTARRGAHRNGRREVTLADIYASFGEMIGIDGETLSVLAKCESDLEIAAIRVDPAVLECYRRILAAGRRVVLASDMYLPHDVIMAMLDRVRIGGFERLYLSSETDAPKGDGSLWPRVRAEFALTDDARIVHLGDNPGSDGTAAERAGITAFLLTPPATLPERIGVFAVGKPDWLGDAFAALAGQRPPTDDDTAYWRRLGLAIAAPAALAMAVFSRNAARRVGAEKVHFLARDGLIFKKVYDILFAGQDAPPSTYLWASRRCFNIASLDRIGDGDLDFLVSGFSRMPPSEYLARIGLDPTEPDVLTAIERRFPALGRPLSSGADYSALRDLFIELAPLIRARAADERGALLRHLGNAGVFSVPGLAVDLGWHGSLQRSMIRLGRSHADADPDLSGAYFGTFPQAGAAVGGIDLVTSGFLFDRGEPNTVMATLRECVEIPELLFSAPEAGIIRIKETDAGLAPCRSPAGAEEERRIAIARIVHETITDAAKALAPVVAAEDFLRLKPLVIERFEALLRRPSPEDIARLGAVPHADGFGIARYRPLVPP
ncbi:MAG: hypothetical protein KDJ16_18745, partial [Hyphomicrobiales bacterium]|nr:hypothetical protein [Hyphomicrobiales bacterium]